MGADDDAGVARGRLQQRLLALRGVHGAGEEHHARAVQRASQHPALREGTEGAGEGLVVLHGQYLGGCQQGCLSPGVDHLQHGAQCHEGFTGAHFALEQPVHRVVPGQVSGQGLAHLPLSVRQGERQPGVELVEQSAGARRPRGRFLARGQCPTAGERGLEHEGLLVPEPVLRAVGVLHDGWAVHEFVGLREAHQLVPARHRLRHRVDQVGGVEGVEDDAHGHGDPLAADLVHCRVHGNRLVHVLGVVVVVVQEHVLGIGERELPPVHRDLAGEHGAYAGTEFPLRAVPVEVGEVHLPDSAGGIVRDDHLEEHALAGAHAAGVGRLHAGDQGDLLVHRDLCNGGQLAALEVVARKVVEQLAHGVEVQVLCQELGGRPEVLLERHVKLRRRNTHHRAVSHAGRRSVQSRVPPLRRIPPPVGPRQAGPPSR